MTQDTSSTHAAETRAVLARSRQAEIAHALYEIDAWPRRQTGAHVPLFAAASPRVHEDYFARARGVIAAGYRIVPAGSPGTPLEEVR